jgi:hypothetical protein
MVALQLSKNHNSLNYCLLNLMALRLFKPE